MKSLLRWGLPILSIALIGFASWKAAEPILADARSAPMQTDGPILKPKVVGVGIVEPSGQRIAVGLSQSGLVEAVHVQPGQPVQRGEVLVQLDSRMARAEQQSKQSELEHAKRKLDRLRSLPRPENVALVRSRLDVAKIVHATSVDQLSRIRKLAVGNMASEEEINSRAFAEAKASAEVKQFQAELDQALVGSTAEELAIAGAEVSVAQHALDKAIVQLGLLTIVAPCEAHVLKCDLRAGEFIDIASKREDSPIHLAGCGPLHVRVEFDEEEATRVARSGTAVGTVRGRNKTVIEMRFVRAEPYLQSKRNLMGHGTERVDTRVLQILYEIIPTEHGLLPGQAIDVVAEAALENQKLDENLSIASPTNPEVVQ
jgi:HlyD family secretion protein